MGNRLHDIARDVRFSARLLARERLFTAIAVVALSLGVGVNNTLFTVVNAICIRGLPIEDADRVIDVSNLDVNGRRVPLTRNQVDVLFAARPSAVAAFSAFAARPAVLRDDQSAAETVTVAYVTHNAFAVVRQQPMIGREFRPDDDAGVAILGADIWRTRYGADPALVGRDVRLDGVTVSVVGVMPDQFRFPDNADVWRPIDALRAPADTRIYSVYGRLAAHAVIPAVRDAIIPLLTVPGASASPRIAVVPINDRYVGDITNPAWITFITVGLLLVVIACSNVANLLLARGARRGREMAIRISIGATRGRIIRQLLVESALLAAAGGLGAAAVSTAGLRLLAASIPAGGLPYWITLTMDARVVTTLVVVCLGTVILFGLAPALQLARTSPNAAIKETSAAITHNRGAARWTWGFLLCQLALTVMLLSKLGFAVQEFYGRQPREGLVDAAHVLTFSTVLPGDAYREPERRLAFYRTLTERLTAAGGGTTAVGVASALPTSGGTPRAMAPEDQPLTESSVRVGTVLVDGEYFRALGLNTLEGRTLGSDRTAIDEHGIIVNQRLAELFFPGRSAIGHRIRVGAAPGAPPGPGELRSIVGVIPSVRLDSVQQPAPAAYLPLTPAEMLNATVLVRTTSAASALAPVLRDEVRRLDPAIAVNRVMTLERANWNARWNPRVATRIITTIALIAFALATIGLAALTADAVAQRGRELGVRLALGATPSSVVLLVLRRVLLQAVAGVALGSVGAFAWDRSTAPAIIAAASLFVVAVVVGVSAWPAAGAARIDPLAMLRDQ